MRLLRVFSFLAYVAGALWALAAMPRWDNALKRYVRGSALAPAPSAARAANGDSGWLNCEDFDSMTLELAVTAVGGDANETLDVVVETAKDAAGANTRAAQGSPFAQKTQPGGVQTERKTFSALDAYYRVRWTLAGTTPTFTFSVLGDSK